MIRFDTTASSFLARRGRKSFLWRVFNIFMRYTTVISSCPMCRKSNTSRSHHSSRVKRNIIQAQFFLFFFLRLDPAVNFLGFIGFFRILCVFYVL